MNAPVCVLKFGGEVVAEPAALAAVMADVAVLAAEGMRCVLLHGGGPQAGALSRALGLPVTQVGGRRVTDGATLRGMKQVLAGEVSVDVVAAGMAAGMRAVGICGVSDGLVTAHRRPPMKVSGGGEQPVDFGFVGDVDEIRTQLIEHLWAGGFVPVVNTLGIEGHGATRQVYNINADTVASAVAGALKADHLMLVTQVGGVRRDKDDPSTRIGRLTASQARAAIADGTIVGGMIPKVEEALANLALGIGAVHILGPEPGVVAAAAREPGRSGTVLVADEEVADA